jgi:hypothetical protein
LLVSRVKARDFKASDLAKLSWENGLTKNLGQNQTARAQWRMLEQRRSRRRHVRRAGLDCYNGLVGLASVAALRRAAPGQSAARVHSCNLLWNFSTIRLLWAFLSIETVSSGELLRNGHNMGS